MTCTTCSTLNPPDAPACVRCNTPLTPPAGRCDPAGAGAAPVARPADGRTTDGDPAGMPGMVGRPRTGVASNPAGVPGMFGRPGTGVAPDPTEGSKRIGRGLAGAAQGAPGSSRARAAAVQPPGYGLDTAAAEPAAEPAPAEDPRVGRRVAVLGALLVAAVLAVGGLALWLTRPAYLDTAAVQRTIGEQLSRRLGGPVAVTCPDGQRRRAGVTFSCTAADNAGDRRAVTVTVVDNSGKYTWALRTA